MPNVNVMKKELFKFIGREFTDEEFINLCFEFGLEMEQGDGTEMQMTRVDDKGTAIDISKEEVYKLEVAANRYDLLCLEGISQILKSYLGFGKIPRLTIKNQREGPLERIIVKPETQEVRPFVVGAILRNITFDIQSYNSFIDLQDKLHQNICRKRTLGSMGTHDYDKIQGPITYEARHPRDIVFQALKQTESMNAEQLFEKLRQDQKLKKYLHIIENKPKFPVFYDANGQVLSLPPIINSDATKVSLDTKNVFIEMTGTDLHKIEICLIIVAGLFSSHCAPESEFTIEQVEVHHEVDGRIEVFPQLTYHEFEVQLSQVNKTLGLSMDIQKAKECAEKMGLLIKDQDDTTKLVVEVPPIRSDVLHACDIIEDIGIAFGYNNIPRELPPTNTIGMQQPLNKFSDLVRIELGQAGYIECLTMSLLSIKENYEFLNKPFNENEAIQISNPKTIEFEVVRTSLIPGLLKVFQSNMNESLPQKVFEVSDVAMLDDTSDVLARNERRISAMYMNTNSGFEIIQGVVDLIMTKIGAKHGEDYRLQESDDPMYFPRRGANVVLSGKVIGSLGVLHPQVLDSFHIKYPVTCFELRLNEIFEHFKLKSQ
ncbi:phenylalanyl-trna synthetase beta chain [Stylonychia lemnae]|uniref:phenylalanine--tRNA ligase n=1 Tax=Stylonychia lemnae TaxID=5949 RepID=A0A078A2W4_STYLE|nr:phenylalanyl-trna synthetase beta chain [Stylonychia lemnae]|eukprot:CDW75114.1 phenylalanyl-trna synthetase beta chain [Stylonychia lemnae]